MAAFVSGTWQGTAIRIPGTKKTLNEQQSARVVQAILPVLSRSAASQVCCVMAGEADTLTFVVHIREDGVCCGGRRITPAVPGFQEENHNLGAGDGVVRAKVADGCGGTSRGDSVTIGLVSPRFERMSVHVCKMCETAGGMYPLPCLARTMSRSASMRVTLADGQYCFGTSEQEPR